MSEDALVKIMRDFELKYNEKMEMVKMTQVKQTEQIREIGFSVDRVEKTLKEFIACAEERFAPKWVADVLKWAGAVAGGVIIVYIINSILK